MAEYIEREALMAALCKEIVGDGDYYNGKDDMQDQIRDMVSRFPAADVATVRHGQWLNIEEHIVMTYNTHFPMTATSETCSECNVRSAFLGKKSYVKDNRCPNCGAKMDLEG